MEREGGGLSEGGREDEMKRVEEKDNKITDNI